MPHGNDKQGKLVKNHVVVFAIASLLWFIFRTGTKPSRIVYPCQGAALANTSLLLGISFPLSLSVFVVKAKRFLSKRGVALVLVVTVVVTILGNPGLFGSLQQITVMDPNQELQLVLEPRNATVSPASDIFVANGRVQAHVETLFGLMASQGLHFYQTASTLDGLVARDDVVLVKVNEEWPYRGGTNTDVLRELIQTVVDHPDGFVGELVVADNGQWQGSMDWYESNAEDITQSTQDVVDLFSKSHDVSTYTWRVIRHIQVDEYDKGDMDDGYILYDMADPQTGMYMSYPKFQTVYGTYISFKHGIWNGSEYEPRLKVINLPVLKSHSVYGVTGCLKHYMGVQSEGDATGGGGLANGHATVQYGSMGTLMAETGLPTLNILDAIWINANPPTQPNPSLAGPSTPYEVATRVNVLMASTDPVALDYWAAKHVLVQAASSIGYEDTHTLNPDSVDASGVGLEAFGVWLNRSRDILIAAGCHVTTDENHMNIYLPAWHNIAVTSILCSGRVEPQPDADCLIVYSDWNATITVEVENSGTFTETFNVSAYYDGSVMATGTVIGLGPQEVTVLELSWDTGGLREFWDWPYLNYTVYAEADVVLDEVETADNRLVFGWEVQIGALCDVDGDGDIDIFDIVIVAAACGQREGDAFWCVFADVAPEYGVIDVFDVYTASLRYGEIYRTG